MAVLKPMQHGVVYRLDEPAQSVGDWQVWFKGGIRVMRLGDCVEITIFHDPQGQQFLMIPPLPLDNAEAGG